MPGYFDYVRNHDLFKAGTLLLHAIDFMACHRQTMGKLGRIEIRVYPLAKPLL